jgi:hypothetical protein
MSIEKRIEKYIWSLSETKSSEMHKLHELILQIMPTCKLWFLDGKNSEGKIISNPNIGYGFYSIKYANGSTKDFYRIGLSANTIGISVYIMSLEDKNYLSNTFKYTIGKASVTGYCIKFKTLKTINLEVLKEAIKFGFSTKTKN